MVDYRIWLSLFSSSMLVSLGVRYVRIFGKSYFCLEFCDFIFLLNVALPQLIVLLFKLVPFLNHEILLLHLQSSDHHYVLTRYGGALFVLFELGRKFFYLLTELSFF